MMRAASLLLLLAVGGLGCFVFEEMDEGMERWSRNRPGSEAPAPESETPRATARRRSVASWEATRTLGGDGMPAGIVPCHVEGRTQYMRESECTGRGGTPQATR